MGHWTHIPFSLRLWTLGWGNECGKRIPKTEKEARKRSKKGIVLHRPRFRYKRRNRCLKEKIIQRKVLLRVLVKWCVNLVMLYFSPCRADFDYSSHYNLNCHWSNSGNYSENCTNCDYCYKNRDLTGIFLPILVALLLQEKDNVRNLNSFYLSLQSKEKTCKKENLAKQVRRYPYWV